MTLFQLIQTAQNSLLRHAGRSLLTMLGIIIGIASIIAIVAIGKGAERKIQAQIAAMGENYIGVTMLQTSKKNKLRGIQQKSRSKLKMIDESLLKRNVPHIHHISPFIAEKGSASFFTNSIDVVIKGGNESLLSIIKRYPQEGTGIHHDHLLRHSRVAVIGNGVANDLGCTLDSHLNINNVPFHIIGILKPMQTYLGTEDPNYNIFIPITSLKKYIQKRSNSNIHSLIINTKTPQEIPLVTEKIAETMRMRHRLQPGEPNDFLIATQESLAKTAAKTSSTFTIFLFLIALIALIVGGIGIMNIMLVAVSERHKEIGIRKSLGATEQNICHQFLIEAVVLCVVGGFLGIILGILSAVATKTILGWPVAITLTSLIGATAITCLIGLFFGFYPAYTASQLNPVDALCER